MRSLPRPSALITQVLGVLAVLGVCALAAAGCNRSSPSSSPDASAGFTCSSDAECQTGFKCDRDSRQCVCTGDTACPTGQFCNAFTGLCVGSVPGCTTDSVCPTGQYCNRGLRSCQALTAICGRCTTDSQCGASSKCAANPSFPSAGTFCSPLCVAQDAGSACPGGLVCSGTLCVPASGACGVTNACVPDALGVCSSDADCAADPTQQCDAQLKACVAKNRACPPGDACDPQQRVCAHACAIDSDCTAIEGGTGYTCRNNACFKLDTCQTDADCSSANKQICAPNPDGSKSCKPGCVTPTDCPLGQGCNNDPSHPRCSPSCLQNSDCALNSVCQSGACASSFGSCIQACQATAACTIGQACSSAGCCTGGANADFLSLCPHGCTANVANNCFSVAGKACVSQNDCNLAFPNGGTTCKPFGATNECVGTLGFKPCTGDSDCPYKGFRCQAFAGSATALCLPYEAAAVAACFLAH
jgi:hypothetical protein